MDYFTFEIDNKKVGYYEESDEDGVLYCKADMEMQGEVFSNPFWLRYEGDTVLAYKHADGEFITFNEAENVYPSSAILLIIRKMKNKNTGEYVIFHEGEGKVGPTVLLRRNGNRIEEYTDGNLGRYFVVDENDRVIEYCWGGTAISKRVGSLKEAQMDTVFE